MKTTKEMFEVMQAYADGKKIEYKTKTYDEWRDIDDPAWNWEFADYRVKSEPKYVPYDSVMEFDRHKWVKLKNSNILRKIVQINSMNNTVHVGRWIPLIDMFYYFEYEDGTPCGKLKGE